MTPAEVVDFYSQEDLLGKMPSGEPIAADIVTMGRQGPEPVTGLKFPTSSKIRFFPQSELVRPPQTRGPLGYFSADIDKYMRDPKLYPGIDAMLRSLTQKYRSPDPRGLMSKTPEPIHLGSLAAPEGVGGTGYQMAYDAIRGAGDLNVADALTSRNILRRPLNVANTFYSRGDFENLLPISEKGTGYGSESLVSRVHGMPGSPGDQQSDIRQYLAGLFGSPDPLDPDVSKLLTVTADKTAKKALQNPEGVAGYLELMNAVRAAQMRIPGYGQDVHPSDFQRLKSMVDPVIKNTFDRSGVVGGLGPGALGRARTTEEAVLGMRMGMTPEEIAQRILQGSKDPATEFKGRYRRGGLAAAA